VTCGVSKIVVQNLAMKSLTPIVVWIPMLDADELPAAEEASARFSGLALPQFWDGSQRLGKEVGRSIGAPEWVALCPRQVTSHVCPSA
jgi:hypothetical protein